MGVRPPWCGAHADHLVQGQVVTYAGTTYIYKAQVVVTYGVLGY